MSIFIIGAWYWVSVGLLGILATLLVAIAVQALNEIRPALHGQFAALRERLGDAAVSLQKPLPSSPSHRSSPRV
jgi:hypothetical protein